MINTILHADCMDIMPCIPGLGREVLAVVDPPYRNENENQPTKDMRKNCTRFVKGQLLGEKPGKHYFELLFQISKDQIIWGANNFENPPYKGFIAWKKKTISESFSMSMAEIASLSEGLSTISKVVEFAPQGSKIDPRIHPTQKPVALYRWILQKYAKPGQLVLDTHSGSGSLACACHLEGYDFVAIEKDYDYWLSSCKRLEELRAQGLLF